MQSTGPKVMDCMAKRGRQVYQAKLMHQNFRRWLENLS
jgi:hypothetical protein